MNNATDSINTRFTRQEFSNDWVAGICPRSIEDDHEPTHGGALQLDIVLDRQKMRQPCHHAILDAFLGRQLPLTNTFRDKPSRIQRLPSLQKLLERGRARHRRCRNTSTLHLLLESELTTHHTVGFFTRLTVIFGAHYVLITFVVVLTERNP